MAKTKRHIPLCEKLNPKLAKMIRATKGLWNANEEMDEDGVDKNFFVLDERDGIGNGNCCVIENEDQFRYLKKHGAEKFLNDYVEPDAAAYRAIGRQLWKLMKAEERKNNEMDGTVVVMRKVGKALQDACAEYGN